MKQLNCKQILSWILLLSILGVYSFFIIYNANWIMGNWGDDYQLLQTTAVGRLGHGGTWEGRFFPLAFCDYSLLLLLFPHGASATAHLVFNSITMIIATGFLFCLLTKLTSCGRALISIGMLFVSVSFIHIQ